MAEVIWVALFGMALAWLQSQSQAPERVRVDESTWDRWEDEIHEWADD